MARRCCLALTSTAGPPSALPQTGVRARPFGPRRSQRCKPYKPTDGSGSPHPRSTTVQTPEWKAGAESGLGSIKLDELASLLRGCPRPPVFALRSFFSRYEPYERIPILSVVG